MLVMFYTNRKNMSLTLLEIHWWSYISNKYNIIFKVIFATELEKYLTNQAKTKVTTLLCDIQTIHLEYWKTAFFNDIYVVF